MKIEDKSKKILIILGFTQNEWSTTQIPSKSSKLTVPLLKMTVPLLKISQLLTKNVDRTPLGGVVSTHYRHASCANRI